MKSFNRFYGEAVVLAKQGGVQGKLDKATNTFTKGAWSDAESARHQKYSKPVAPKPAAPKPATGVSTGPAPTPRPKDDKPTIAQVAAVKKAAETQRNRNNLRFGVELGGLARKTAQQNYTNQNSLVAQGAEANRQAAIPQWKKHPFTQNKKDTSYGIPDFVSDRRRENQGAMSDNNRYRGMSDAEADAKATRDEAELHKKNMRYMKNRRGGYQPGSGY
jgi:hypothetical protein